METELLNKQWNSNLKPSEDSLGIFGILKESFKTIKRNRKLLLSVLLVVFLLFSQLDLAQDYLLEPVAKDFSLQLKQNPELLQDFGNKMHQTSYSNALEDIRAMLLVNILATAFNLIIGLVFFVATVSSSYEAYTAKVLGPKDLISKIKNSWTKPMLTGFYFVMILFGSFLVCSLSYGIFTILAVDSSAYVLYGVVFFLIAILCLYVGPLWIMSMVVSVVEDVGGLNAVVRAQGLLKGKRVQASLIMVIAAVGYYLVDWTMVIVSSYTTDKWSKLAVSIPFSNGLVSMLKIFLFVVFTVFYHERKGTSSSDEKEAKGLSFPIAVGDF